MSAHNPKLRAEAAVPRHGDALPDPVALAHATPPVHGHKWQPVRGPHLRVVRGLDRRNKTGCVGISYTRSQTKPNFSHFCAQLGPTCRKFRIETLGRHEAFRRAVAARAEHEIKVREANAAILNARNQHTHHA